MVQGLFGRCVANWCAVGRVGIKISAGLCGFCGCGCSQQSVVQCRLCIPCSSYQQLGTCTMQRWHQLAYLRTCIAASSCYPGLAVVPCARMGLRWPCVLTLRLLCACQVCGIGLAVVWCCKQYKLHWLRLQHCGSRGCLCADSRLEVIAHSLCKANGTPFLPFCGQKNVYPGRHSCSSLCQVLSGAGFQLCLPAGCRIT